VDHSLKSIVQGSCCKLGQRFPEFSGIDINVLTGMGLHLVRVHDPSRTEEHIEFNNIPSKFMRLCGIELWSSQMTACGHDSVRTWLIDGNGFSKVGRTTGRGDGVIGVLREWIEEVEDFSDEDRGVDGCSNRE
jgi:hypothetical protein